MGHIPTKPLYPTINYEELFNPVLERPNLFINRDELNDARAKAESYDWANFLYQKIIWQADHWLKKEIEIPNKGGGFFHEGGSDYLITVQHYELTQAAKMLALTYYWTEKSDYFKQIHRIIMGYAERYLTYEVHDKARRTGKDAIAGGRVTPQGINELMWVLPLLWAYDLVYFEFTPAERQKIENGILRPLAELIMLNDEGMHNHQAWYNTAAGVIGVLLQERRYLEYAIDNPKSGFRAQMTNSLRPEGLWYEGSIYYHFFVLKVMCSLTEAFYHSGVNLYQIEPLKKMFDFPLDLINPSLYFTSINDGPPLSMAFPTHEGQAFYELAYRRIGDLKYGNLLSKAPRVLLESLLYGVPELPRGDLNKESRFWPGTGLAALRSGKAKNFKQITFDFLPYAGNHNHQAKLGIELYGLGRTLAPDPGSIIYRDRVHLEWYKKTVAHNCLVVDGKNQEKTDLTPIVASGSGPALDFIKVSDNGLYPGVNLTRTTGVTDDFIIDIYQVTSVDQTEHTYDWIYHNYGRFNTDIPLDQVENKETGDGYQYIQDLRRGETWADIRSNWYLSEGWVLLSTLSEGKTQVLAGLGPVADGPDFIHRMRTDPNPIPLVIYRRKTAATVYRTVIQAMTFDGDQWIVTEPETSPEPGVIALKMRQMKYSAYFYIGDNSQTIRVDTPYFRGEGEIIFVKLHDKKVESILIHGKGMVSSEYWSVTLKSGQLQLVAEADGYRFRVTEATEVKIAGLGTTLLTAGRLVTTGKTLLAKLEAGTDYIIK